MKWSIEPSKIFIISENSNVLESISFTYCKILQNEIVGIKNIF